MLSRRRSCRRGSARGPARRTWVDPVVGFRAAAPMGAYSQVVAVRTLVLVAAAVAIAASGAGAATPASFVIQGDRSVGGLAMVRAEPEDAVARFGAAALTRSRPPSCLMVWPRLGLAISFVDFAGNPCRDGGAVVATVTSRARWRTALGLRVGDGIQRLRALYPRATRRTGSFGHWNGFWLVTRRACATVGGHGYPGLLARIRDGRVSALVVTGGTCE